MKAAARSALVASLLGPLAAASAIAPVALAAADSPSALTLEECDRRIQRAPDDVDAYRCFAVVARQTGAGDEVARRMRAQIAFDPDNGHALYTLAGVLSAQGDPRTEQAFRDAAAAYARGGAVVDQARVLGELATLFARFGRLDDAERTIADARVAAGVAAQPLAMAMVEIASASLAYARGDFVATRQHLQNAAPAIESEGEFYDRVQLASHQGLMHWRLGDFAAALALYRQQADMLHEAGEFFEEAIARSNVALLYSRTYTQSSMPGTPEHLRSIELVRESWDLARRSGNVAIEAKSLLLLGQVDLDPLDCRVHLRRAREVVDRTNQFEDQLLARRLLAESLILYEPRDIDAGFTLLEEAARLARDRAADDSIARAAMVTATMHWHLHEDVDRTASRRERAIEASLSAMDAVERLCDRQRDQMVRARVFTHFAFFYARAAGHVLRSSAPEPSRDDIRLASRMIERARARVFIDQLHAAGVLAPPGGDGANPPTEALWTEIPAIDEIEESLAANEAALSFQIARGMSSKGFYGGGSWILAHTREGTRAIELGDADDIAARVRLLRGLVDARDGLEREAAARLHEDLLEQALEELPPEIDHLIIVPDGPLHGLPFGLLAPHPDAPPLAARMRLTIAPSLASWRGLRRGAPATLEGAPFVIADPDLSSGEMSFDFPALPHARDEARAVRRHLGRRTTMRVGADATEASLAEVGVRDAGLVHIAAHAVVDERQPEHSALLFGAGPGDDGRLEPPEFAALGAKPRVVVLSACESAGGPVMEGEGVMSLARAFFATGSVAVVGSLWPLRDDEAARFFDLFYEHVAQGETFSEAMASAQREERERGEASAAWAGLVLIGNGDVRLPAAPPWWQDQPVFALTAAAAAALGLAWILIVAARRWPPPRVPA